MHENKLFFFTRLAPNYKIKYETIYVRYSLNISEGEAGWKHLSHVV